MWLPDLCLMDIAPQLLSAGNAFRKKVISSKLHKTVIDFTKLVSVFTFPFFQNVFVLVLPKFKGCVTTGHGKTLIYHYPSVCYTNYSVCQEPLIMFGINLEIKQ